MSYTPWHVEQEDARHYRIVRQEMDEAGNRLNATETIAETYYYSHADRIVHSVNSHDSLLDAAKDAAEWIRMQHGATPTNPAHVDEWHRTADRLEAAIRTAEGWSVRLSPRRTVSAERNSAQAGRPANPR